jgi:two-component system, OmpR family, response regulator
MRILVVEDEPAIADFLERGLEEEGYAVATAGDGVEGERLALEGDFDLVVLDRMLPGKDGIDVLDAIDDAKPALPVILLTAKGELEDRVDGLDRGATDYVTKPFAFAELVARVRVALRQPNGDAATVLEAAGIRLDLLARRVEREGHSVRLPEREAELLAYLMRRPGQVCTRAEILASVWRYDHDPGTNIVQVYIGYLRRRLALTDSPAPIETVRAAGYRLVERP